MKFHTETPSFPIPHAPIGQIAFDGKFYYITLLFQEKILQSTEDFQIIEEIPSKRVYDCLCFDTTDCCFWATIAGCTSRIFQLDCQFREIACHCISLPFGGKITGLSYCACDDSLFIACPSGLGLYEKENRRFHPLPPVTGLITGVLSICPAYFVLVRRGKTQVLCSFFDSGESITETVLPREYLVQDLCYNSCGTARLDFLWREQCYGKVFSLPVTEYELGFTPCICNMKVCEHCCPCQPPCPPLGGLTQVVESVALIEAALSHILNAQGEELQKIIAQDSTILELIEVNGQINDTIGKVTTLEQVLYQKLEAVKELSKFSEEEGGAPCHSLSTPLIE